MNYFPIVQALCRVALAHPTSAVRKQIERLRDALIKDDDGKDASVLTSLLTAADRPIDLAPSRIVRSRVQTPSASSAVSE